MAVPIQSISRLNALEAHLITKIRPVEELRQLLDIDKPRRESLGILAYW